MGLRKLGGTVGAAFVAFLIITFGTTAQIQKPSDCGDPPWFNAGGKCAFSQKTSISSNTINWPKRKPGETDCYLTILVCNFKLQRDTKKNPLGTQCPTGQDFSQPTFCCDEFEKAVKTKQPCDPMKDADCDGLPNDTDPDPLAPQDPDSDNKCGTLASDVNNAYRKAGASVQTALDAGESARKDCYRRRHDKKCGNPTPTATPYEYKPLPPNLHDPDKKCEALGFDLFDAYLKAGASEDTALSASRNAQVECLKKRAGM